MSKVIKILRIILLVILVLIIVGAVAVNLFADYAVKVGIESPAAKALNIGIAVGDVDLSIISGKLAVKNLSIKNPPVYRNEELLVLRNTEIEVETKSLLSDVVNIKQIKINDVEVIIEQHSVSENNLQDIIKSISESTYEGKMLRVDNLEISDITVKFDLTTDSAQSEPAALTLSPIKMTNLGHDNKMDTAALLKKIVYAIADSIVKEGISVLPKDIVGTMTSTLSKTMGLGTKIMEGKEDIGKNITEAFKNLFKPKKEE
ncbi:MAG: AsmA family protein [Sedimentisphaerales bacterium]|nr:AsmA family protein [Sedimentisphaerales bacterium]